MRDGERIANHELKAVAAQVAAALRSSDTGARAWVALRAPQTLLAETSRETRRRQPAIAATMKQTMRNNISAAELVATTDHEGTTFVDCDFSGADLGPLRLVDCTFERCNLSNAAWRGTALNNVTFIGSKLLGADLSNVRRTFLSVAFEDCKLDYVDFRSLPLAKTRFVRSSLREAFFGGTNLSGAVFDGCDVGGATFRDTNLTAADLRGAEGLVLDPDTNTIQKARFHSSGLAGLLTKYKLDID